MIFVRLLIITILFLLNGILSFIESLIGEIIDRVTAAEMWAETLIPYDDCFLYVISFEFDGEVYYAKDGKKLPKVWQERYKQIKERVNG